MLILLPMNMTFWRHLPFLFKILILKRNETLLLSLHKPLWVWQNSQADTNIQPSVWCLYNVLSNSLSSLCVSRYKQSTCVLLHNCMLLVHFPCLQNNIPMIRCRNMDKWLGFYMSSTSWWSHPVPLSHKCCLWSVSIQ